MADTTPVEAFPVAPEKIPETGNSSQRAPQRKPRKWWQLGGQDYSFVSVDDGYDIPSQTPSQADIETLPKSSEQNVFEDAAALDIYKPIEGYEGAHRFDPSATWTSEEEKTLVRFV